MENDKRRSSQNVKSETALHGVSNKWNDRAVQQSKM